MYLFPVNMAKRSLNLSSDAMHDLIEPSEEEKDFSEISSGSDEETVLLGNIAGTSGSVRIATGGACDLQSEYSSASDFSDSESDSAVDNAVYRNNAERVINGHKGNRFTPKYDAGIKG
jgi:hypothetical protein